MSNNKKPLPTPAPLFLQPTSCPWGGEGPINEEKLYKYAFVFEQFLPFSGHDPDCQPPGLITGSSGNLSVLVFASFLSLHPNMGSLTICRLRTVAQDCFLPVFLAIPSSFPMGPLSLLACCSNSCCCHALPAFTVGWLALANTYHPCLPPDHARTAIKSLFHIPAGI